MIVKCYAKDCIYNTENICTKDEIEVCTISVYDNYFAECLDYEERNDKKMKCGLLECCFNEEGMCDYGTSIKYEAPCWNSEPVYEGNIITHWINDESLVDDDE